MLFFVWCLGFSLNFYTLASGVSNSKEQGDQNKVDFTVSIILISFFIIACFQPCIPVFYRTARIETVKSLWQIIIAPFGKVRFRDFFLADVITSMGSSLGDLGLIAIMIKDGTHAQKSDISWYFTLISFAPYWWRFWQCLNKWYKLDNNL